MPFVSKAQQRFMHTDTARKKGITPAMVREYDEASRGLKLPERAPEKKAELTGRLLKVAETASELGVSMPTLGNKARAIPGPKPAPWPGDYRPAFVDAMGQSAQRGSQEKLQTGESMSMPVLR